MRLFSSILFLTLVGSALTVRAATTSSAPRPGLPSAEQTAAETETRDPEKSRTLQWTPSPNAPLSGETVVDSRKPAGPRSPYGIGVHVGLLAGQILEKSENETTTIVGGTFTWEDLPERAWDFEADVTASNCLRLGAARRFEIETATVDFVPYWSVGLTQTMQGSRLLASLVDLERFKAVANFGFADLFDQDRQWTAEVGVGWGLAGAVFSLQAGWSYNW